MSERRPARVEAGGPAPAIKLQTRASAKAQRATRWHLMLVAFMRIVGALWLLQGLVHWHDILVPVPSLLETLPPAQAALLAGFAVLDLVAAVGLWLATPWGGVLWILAAAAQMATVALAKGFFPSGEIMAMIDAALILAYLFLTYRAGQEELARGD